jgi:class 3 adenylate cyclase/tetratricopeptide (TPR) repeat protein
MVCPQCRFENREGAKFCSGCGAKLEVKCRSCSHLNLPGSNYCEDCGANLTRPAENVPKEFSITEKLDKLQRYLPQGLTEKILAHRDKIEGERKHVTVLFCDMAGFTPVVEKLGSEEAYSLMDRIYEILIHKVHRYEGTVNEMTGDGIMALFGAPIALEDAPQRAIRSAMSIHREMAEFSQGLTQSQGGLPPVKMRIGIHTGPVVVGTLGNNLRVEFKAVGDTVNMAARMQQLAEPGTTYVTDETFKLAEGYFRFEALGDKTVKGKSRPLRAYRVIAAGTSKTRFDVGAERGLTPFVGRDRELELLLDGFDRSKAGRGQAYSVIAEAGVGKSRLLYEFRKAVANENVTFLEGRCLSYSRGISYHPLIDVVKQNFDIRESDGDAEITGKVSKGLKALALEDEAILAALLDLLSVQVKDPDGIPLTPEARKNRIIKAYTRIVLEGSEIRPLILAFEDLHWIDEGSEEAFKAILDAIAGARIFLIFTYRPEFVHTWGGRSYHSQINLNRLSNRECLSVASHLLDGFKIDEDLERLIIEKSDGVPFYVEELIGFLKRKEIIKNTGDTYHLIRGTGELPLPSSIQDVIMARVDSLSSGAKVLLQTGSVAGREFSHDLIKNVSEIPHQQLLTYLSVLKDAELLYERGIYPQSIYVFKHVLTRDIAYRSLIQKKRKEIHEKVGKALEQIYSERLAEVYEILAFHFLNGEDWERAYKYCLAAGEKSFSRSVYEEARKYVEEAFTALQKMPSDKTRIEQEIDLRFYMRSVLVPLGRHDEWGEWVRGAESLARKIGDDARLANVLNLLSSLHWIHDIPHQAIEVAQKALVLARKTNHISYQVSIMYHLGIYCFSCGDYVKQIEYQQEVRGRLTGTAAYSQHGLSSFPGGFVRGHMALGMAELGEFNQIEELGREAMEIVEKVENALTLVLTYTCLGMAYLRYGKLELALEYLEKSYEVCLNSKVTFVRSYTAGAIGQAYILDGKLKQALAVLTEGTRPEYIERGIWTVHLLTVLADAYRVTGDVALALDTLSRALDLAAKSGERGFESWAMVVMARIKSDMEQVDEATQWYDRSLKQADELSMRPLVAHCHQGLGELYRRLGKKEEALSEFDTANGMYRALGMTYHMHPQALIK